MHTRICHLLWCRFCFHWHKVIAVICVHLMRCDSLRTEAHWLYKIIVNCMEQCQLTFAQFNETNNLYDA